MARYVLLRIDDDEEADDLLRDVVTAPTSPLLTPRFERSVHVEIVPGIDAGDRTRDIQPALQLNSKYERADVLWLVRDSYKRAHQLADEEAS